jgi:hypothetical protein
MVRKSITIITSALLGLGVALGTAAEPASADHYEGKRSSSIGGHVAIDFGHGALVIGGTSKDGRRGGKDDFFVGVHVGPQHAPPAGRRWVPAHYVERKVRVLVEPAHYEERQVSVLVEPGHFEERHTRVLVVPGHYEVRHVPAVYRTVHDPWGRCVQVLVKPACYERVWVPDQFETRCERVWVPDRYETRCQRVLVPDRYEERWERVLVPGHWEEVPCGPRR